ncbi:RING-type E3 ubiquitin transferase, partial [Sarracenia purpurea var. burkii]
VQDGNNPLGNDYSLQSQPVGGVGFLNQSHMIFTNGVGKNPRKRGREFTATTSSVNPFSTQPPDHHHDHQLIDLTQLQTSPQPNVVSTGLRLAFGEQPQQQQLRQQLPPQQQTPSPQSSVLLTVLSEDFTAQIRQQRDEIEQFLRAQGEQLRRTIAEKRQRDYRALLGAAEMSVARRLREKEAEVEKATLRHAELEARAAQLRAEAQVWQTRARAQEAAAASLQAQLQQAIMCGSGGCTQQLNRGDELGYAAAAGEAEDAESAYIDPDRVVVAAASGPSCKACRKRVASVVLLPCRHLCTCTECAPLAQACPLCLTFKESSVEVFLS